MHLDVILDREIYEAFSATWRTPKRSRAERIARWIMGLFAALL